MPLTKVYNTYRHHQSYYQLAELLIIIEPCQISKQAHVPSYVTSVPSDYGGEARGWRIWGVGCGVRNGQILPDIFHTIPNSSHHPKHYQIQRAVYVLLYRLLPATIPLLVGLSEETEVIEGWNWCSGVTQDMIRRENREGSTMSPQ